MGLALDRYGPRRVVATLLAIAACGGLVYVTATDVVGLTMGRFLIGVGMAASLTGGFTAGRLWFPPERLATITAALMALTALGGMLASRPMAALLTVVSWRGVLAGLAGACLVLMLSVLAIVPRHDAAGAAPADRDRPLRAYGAILVSLRFWRFTPVAMGGLGVAIAYQTLWVPLWLRDVAGYDATAQAWVLFAMFAAILFGNLGFGWLSTRVGGGTRALQALALGGFGPVDPAASAVGRDPGWVGAGPAMDRIIPILCLPDGGLYHRCPDIAARNRGASGKRRERAGVRRRVPDPVADRRGDRHLPRYSRWGLRGAGTPGIPVDRHFPAGPGSALVHAFRPPGGPSAWHRNHADGAARMSVTALGRWLSPGSVPFRANRAGHSTCCSRR